MNNHNKNNNILLTPEQSAKAVELRHKAGRAALALSDITHTKKSYGTRPIVGIDGQYKMPSALTLLSYDIEQGMKKVSSVKANGAAKKHYKNNQTAYQSTALTEASAAGVTIEGWDSASAEQDTKPTVGKLQFELVNDHGSKPVEIDLIGSMEEAQDAALYAVLDAEMSPAMDLVQNPQITLPDGTQQTWQAFTAPAIERQMAQER